MSVRKYCAALGAVTLAAAGLSLTVSAPAGAAPTPPSYAEPQFQVVAGDLIGAGSDTTQFVVGDLAARYNSTVAGSGPRIASYASCQPPVTYDSCKTYSDDPSVTITLPGDSTAINRPKGSGDGRKLLGGTTNKPQVLFARSSGTLSATDPLLGKITAYPFAVDSLVMVTANTTNAPATLSAKQILDIYTGVVDDWAQVGGKPGAIHAYEPQTGSGTRDFFEGQLKAVNGGTAATYSGAHDKAWNPATGSFTGAPIQEHNPSMIKGDPNAIAPFSLGRIALTGNLVHAVKGFQADRAVYNYVRKASEAANALGGADWTEGGAVVNALFGSTGFFCDPAQRQLIADEGFFQLLQPADGGKCGVANDTNTGTPAQNAAGLGAVPTVGVTVTNGTKSSLPKVDVTVTGASGTPTGDVVLNVGSKSYTATLSSGAASITIPDADLPTGTYDVNVAYLGDAQFETAGFPKVASAAKTVDVHSAADCAAKGTTADAAQAAYDAAVAKVASTKTAAASANAALSTANANVAAGNAAVAKAKAAVAKAKKALKKAKGKTKKAKAKKKLVKAKKNLGIVTSALATAKQAQSTASAKSAVANAAYVAATKDLVAKKAALDAALAAETTACA